MLLQGHNLDGIISQICYLRQNICTEFVESAHLLLFRSHSDMTFINERIRTFSRLTMPPFIWFFRSPYLSAELLGHRILDCPCNIGRKSFSASPWPFDEKFVESPMIQENVIQDNLPVSVSYWLESIGLRALPVVEITDEIDLVCIGSPLPENPMSLTIIVHTII